MDITSLLQEAPSRDRARRKQTSWEENGGAKTTSGEQELAPQNAVTGNEYTPVGTANKSEYPQPVYHQKQQGLHVPEYTDVQGAARMKNKEMVDVFKPELHSNLPTDAHIINESNTRSEEIIALAPPRTPSPAIDPVHLGIYVYPSLPFPIRPSSLPYNRRTTLTVLVPSSLLPHHHNATNKANGIYADSRAHRLWGGIPHMDTRMIYTDDSDVVFAALHSASIPDDPSLFSSGQDLKLLLRVYPAPESGHFVGGKGAAGLTSASWGNAHEGCAYTISEATWVPPSTARSYTRQTRKARMAEYAQRRATIMSSQSSSLLLVPSQPTEQDISEPADPSSPLSLKPELHPIEEEMASLRVIGGWQAAVGFKYDPVTLYLMLFAFPVHSYTAHGMKRRKLDGPRVYREVILENSRSKREEGRTVLIPRPQARHNDPGAMEVDADGSQESPNDTFMRYDLYRETEPAKLKGVRFVEAPGKDEMREEESWTRTLLHENLGHQDILFTPGFLLVGEEKYVVDTWRWKSHAEDRKRVTEKAAQAQLAKAKKRSVKKRKMKRKAGSETAPAGGPSKVEGNTTGGQAMEVPLTVPEGDATASAAQEVQSLPTDAPTISQEDREEGELSDETPAAT